MILSYRTGKNILRENCVMQRDCRKMDQMCTLRVTGKTL